MVSAGDNIRFNPATGGGGAVLFLSFSGVRPKVGTATATRVPGDVPHPRGTPCDL